MAAIDKLCKFSDEYVGPDMYRWNRNHIQIHPQYRKKFRGATAKLHIIEIEYLLMENRSGGCYSYQWLDEYHLHGWVLDGKPYAMGPHEFLEIQKENRKRLVLRYRYVLRVEEKELHGIVDGEYYDQSFQLGTLRRRLSRMLGHKVPVVWDCARPNFRERKRLWAIPKERNHAEEA